VAFRPAAFVPGFQKHARRACAGMEVHVTDRRKLDSLLLGLVALQACRAANPEKFGWRAEPYEFVADVPAIELLTGDPSFRTVLEGDGDLRAVLAGYEADRQAFLARRAQVLAY
jgi:uncharacterized protein YbbC (DUF1343 family)